MPEVDNPVQKTLATRAALRHSDLHCHVLPGLDDGPRDMEGALRLARAARDSGAARVFATPHIMPGVFSASPDEIRAKVRLLRQRLVEEDVDLEVLEGSEVAVSERLVGDFRAGMLLPLQGSRFILVELPSVSLPRYAMDMIFKLKVLGAGVILAHPERNNDVRRDRAILTEMVETGVYLQVNAGSLIGVYGGEVASFARRLIKEGLAHFVGSDAHSGDSPDLRDLGPDIRPALMRAFRTVRERERFVRQAEERVEELVSGRLR